MAKKEAAAAPKASEWAREIIEKAPAGIMVMDRAGRVTDFNPAAATISGYSRDEALGRPALEVLVSEVDREDCPLRAAMRGQEVEPQEMAIRNRWQQTVPLMLSAFPLKKKGGAILGGVINFRDLTAIKRLEKERRHLVNMFAHDLKTPVVGMAGLVKRLLQGKAGPLLEPQQNYLEIIDREMRSLEQLINNFLEFVRLDLHLLTPLPSALQVESECQEIIALLQPLAEAKGITLEMEYPQEVLVLQADPLLFRRALENLLENAIKYSPPRTTVTLTVKDQGQEVFLLSKTKALAYPRKTCPISLKSITGARPRTKKGASAWDWPQSSALSKPTAAASGWRAAPATAPPSILLCPGNSPHNSKLTPLRKSRLLSSSIKMWSRRPRLLPNKDWTAEGGCSI